MKKIICLAFALLAVSCAPAQTNYTWKITLKTVDEQSSPVLAAKASIWFYTNSELTSIDGTTDTNGLFIATRSQQPGVVAFPMGIQVEKESYYVTRAQLDLGDGYDAARWNQTVPLLLKKVRKPIAMYVRHVDEGPPVFNEPVGYDLMVGDWVAPQGKGLTADIIFNGKLDRKSKNDFDYKLTVSFPKVGDGIQEFTVPDSEKGGGLRSPHEASTNGYQTEVIKTMSHHPGLGAKDDIDDPNRNYFFRVRTVKDHEGNIVSAHYGKIYGDFMRFSYFLNPTPNDRNIEFDPKQNLLHGLDALEQVTAP